MKEIPLTESARGIWSETICEQQSRRSATRKEANTTEESIVSVKLDLRFTPWQQSIAATTQNQYAITCSNLLQIWLNAALFNETHEDAAEQRC